MNSEIVKKGKINSLQAVRALAFINVFILHCEGPASGACGVSIFLVLSGFLMMYSYYDRDLSCSLKDCITFSVKKIKRLYPLHIIMMALPMLFSLRGIILNFSYKGLLDFIIQIILNITLLQAWVPVTEFYFSFNGVAWYLSTCLFVYAVFPFILRKFKKLKMNKIILVGIIVFVCQIIVCILLKFFNPFTTSYYFTYIFPIFRLGDFVIGCCLGYIFINVDFKFNRIQATIIEFISLILFACSEFIFLRSIGILGSYHFKYSVLFVPTSVTLVMSFAINKGYISRCLTCKPLIFLGDISAYTFLIHQIVIRYIGALNYRLIHLPDSNLTTILKVVSSFIISILFAVLYRAVERKIREKRRSVKKI